jgi:hypothetical protein
MIRVVSAVDIEHAITAFAAVPDGGLVVMPDIFMGTRVGIPSTVLSLSRLRVYRAAGDRRAP